jgi:hypothetical protein
LIFLMRNVPQIFDAVVGAVTVDVVERLLRPVAEMQRPDCSMGAEERGAFAPLDIGKVDGEPHVAVVVRVQRDWVAACAPVEITAAQLDALLKQCKLVGGRHDSTKGLAAGNVGKPAATREKGSPALFMLPASPALQGSPSLTAQPRARPPAAV